MFDLEKSISDWRKQMLAAGIKTPVPLEELEIHLREEIGRQIQSGQNEIRAFEIAVQKIGQGEVLKTEFKKIGKENWNCSLAWSAWILFVISFFLPANTYGGWGWRCAWLSAGGFFSSEFWRGDWGAIYFASLTLGNVLMIASPFLLPRFSRTVNSLKWLRFSIFAISILVWSYVFLLVMSADRKELEIGCYVWTISFLLLCLSTLKIRGRKTIAVAN